MLADAAVLHGPLLPMRESLALVIALAERQRMGGLTRTEGMVLLTVYPVFVAWMLAG